MTTLLFVMSQAFAAPPVVQGGAGLHFHAGGTFMDQPLENVTDDGYIVPAQGWGGFGGGGGLALEGRFFGFVGLEFDLIYRRDVARSTFTFGSSELPFQISQNAWHVPILLKFIMPKGAVRPNLFGGGEFILPGEPTITQPAGLETPLSASNAAYKAWAFGLGFEVVPRDLPIDLRFPITLRGAYNTGVGPTSGDRATYVIDEGSGVFESIDYTAVWQWHASVTLGVSFFFP
jgi:hypothetical protein